VGGWVGVDVFFVLSGYLITTILLQEVEATGTISLHRFYARRARRLLPALYVVLAVVLVIGVLEPQRSALTWVITSMFYVTNLVVAFAPHLPMMFQHTWTLAAEEQFYLIAPILILATRRRLSEFQRLWCTAAALGVAEIWRLIVSMRGASIVRMYYAPDTHTQGLLLGVLIAQLVRSRDIRVRPIVGVGCLLLLGWLGMIMSWQSPATYMLWLPIAEVTAAGLVLWARDAPRWFTTRRQVQCGRISYGLYLWQPVVFWTLNVSSWPARAPLAVVGSIAVAAVSYNTVERVFRAPDRDAVRDALKLERGAAMGCSSPDPEKVEPVERASVYRR
jgi:peptidoglycan/LPS O-acetylase OafA/YrhL